MVGQGRGARRARLLGIVRDHGRTGGRRIARVVALPSDEDADVQAMVAVEQHLQLSEFSVEPEEILSATDHPDELYQGLRDQRLAE